MGEIAVGPPRLFFGLVKLGGDVQKTIRLSSSNKPFRILEINCDLPFIEIQQGSETEDSIHALTLNLKSDSPPGRFKGTITLRTDNQYQPEIEIPVLGTIE